MTVEQVDAQLKLVEQIHDLRVEIERLRAEMLQAEQNWAADWKHEHDAIIEECARAMEKYIPGQYSLSDRMAFAAAIRALKDRP